MAYQIGKAKQNVGATGQVTSTAVETPTNKIEEIQRYSVGKAGQNTGVQERTLLPEPEKESRVTQLLEQLEKRGESVRETLKEGMTGKITLPEVAVRATGTGLAGISDVLGSVLTYGLKKVAEGTPEILKKPLKEIAVKSIESPVGQAGLQALSQGMESYDSWKIKNPRVAKDIEGGLNIAMFLPVGKILGITGKETGRVAAKQAGKIAGELATTLEKGAIKDKTSFVTQLLRPLQTTAARIAEVPKKIEVGRFFKKAVVVNTPEDVAMIKEVVKIGGISFNKTFLGNNLLIKKATNVFKNTLEKALYLSKTVFSKTGLADDFIKVTVRLGKNPLIVGDAQKTAGKLMNEVNRLIKESGTKSIDLYRVKLAYDKWVRGLKPNIFDAKAQSALTIANKEIRDTLKNNLIKSAKNVPVEEILEKEHLLLNALDILEDKVAREADTALGRLLEKASGIMGTKNKVVAMGGSTIGLAGFGAAAKGAPIATAIGVPAIITHNVYKLLKDPALRLGFAKWLRAIEKTMLDYPYLKSQIGKDVALLKDSFNLVDKKGVSLMEVTDSINSGGIILDIPKLMNMGGSDNYVVSIYPELSKVYTRRVNATDIVDFLKTNKQYLLKKGHTLGGWFDNKTGEYFLDVSVLVKDKKAAINLGKRYNQRAITYLKDFSEILTGGTGEALGGLPPIAERLKDLISPPTLSREGLGAIRKRLKK